VDFVHRPEFFITRKHNVLVTGEGRDMCSVGSLPSTEDGNGFSSQNVVFSSYLEFRTMD
jgi:hypothetical protein